MRVNIKKDELIKIETAFSIFKKSKDNVPLKTIKESLETCFPDYEFEVVLVPVEDDGSKLFVMSVCPEVSTVNKVIEAVMTEKELKAIQKLWESNKKWTIEIDSRIIDPSIIDFDEKELTALLLHEVGHIAMSNSIPTKISTILRYEITKASYVVKGINKSNIFKGIMSLPIFDSCISDGKSKSSFKDEIKADTFAKKAGYVKPLTSALTKLLKNPKYPSSSSLSHKMKKVSAFSTQTLDEFQARKDKLLKASLFHLKEGVTSPFMKEYIEELIDYVSDGENMYEGRKMEFIHECADKELDGYVYTEFSIGSRKPEIPSKADLEYIEAKIASIHSEMDKMMIVSYITHKRDMCDYLITVASDPKFAFKYRHINVKELNFIKIRLSNLLDKAIAFKIPMTNKVNYIQWPTGPARSLYVPNVDYPSGYEG